MNLVAERWGQNGIVGNLLEFVKLQTLRSGQRDEQLHNSIDSAVCIVGDEHGEVSLRCASDHPTTASARRPPHRSGQRASRAVCLCALALSASAPACELAARAAIVRRRAVRAVRLHACCAYLAVWQHTPQPRVSPRSQAARVRPPAAVTFLSDR